jgi:hypothetical protein
MTFTDVPGMDGGPHAGGARPELPWFRKGEAAWATLAVVIVAWDLAAADEQTLSEAFRRCKASPASAAAVAASWAVLTAHLFGVLPRQADPLHAVHVIRKGMPARYARIDVPCLGQEPVLHLQRVRARWVRAAPRAA